MVTQLDANGQMDKMFMISAISALTIHILPYLPLDVVMFFLFKGPDSFF